MIGTIIAIGDELLIGQVLDTNSQWIASQCAAIGIDVRYKITVGDKQEDIINAIDRYQELSDILITTGGLVVIANMDRNSENNVCYQLDQKHSPIIWVLLPECFTRNMVK